MAGKVVGTSRAGRPPSTRTTSSSAAAAAAITEESNGSSGLTSSTAVVPSSILKKSAGESGPSRRETATRAGRAERRGGRRIVFDEARLERVRDFDLMEPTATVASAPVYFLASDSEIVRVRAHRRITEEDVERSHAQAFHPQVIPVSSRTVDTAGLTRQELQAELAARGLPTFGEKKYLVARLDAHLSATAAAAAATSSTSGGSSSSIAQALRASAAQSAVASGATIKASSRVEIRRPARFEGTVTSPSLIVEEGVIFHGITKMKDKK